MGNWFYIIIRTFPFWGIPIGLGLAATGIAKKNKKKYLVIGIVLILTGSAFLWFRLYNTAVPWVHEVLRSARDPNGF